MNSSRLFVWALVVGLAWLPCNWIYIYSTELKHETSLQALLVGIVCSWAFAGGLAYILVRTAKGMKRLKAQQQADLDELREMPLSAMKPHQALLKPGETAYWSVVATLKQMQTVGFSANSSGVSLRVAKGVTIRSGGTRGHAVKGMVDVAVGELVVTDKRIVFAGDAKSFAIPLQSLINVVNYADGFAFHDSKTNYRLVCSSYVQRNAFAIVLEKVLNEKVGSTRAA